jgi:uroporphyrinogen decarboxylase
MTKRERLEHLLTGQQVSPPPFHPILMHFAARYAGSTYDILAQDHRVLVESNIQCLDAFDLDAVSVISDPFRETAAFGAQIDFPYDQVPRCRAPIVEAPSDVNDLPRPDIRTAPRTRDRIDGAREYRARLGNAVPLIGWIEGPLAEACDLAGVNRMLLWLITEPDAARRLMEKCLLTAQDFAQAQIEAGCGIMGIGDAICSQISLPMYRRFVWPLHQQLFTFVRGLGARLKLHICGDITHLLPALAELPIDILDLDWMVDIQNAHVQVGPEMTLCGNLDPVRVIQDLSAQEVYTRGAALVEAEHGRRFILSGGCEITVNTPPENLAQLGEARYGETS